jgi:hypothetical protein
MTVDRTCVYCSRPATTVDHVPAKGLFPKPRPSDLITVPCCLRCNQQGARDDEYFRRVLFLRDDVQAHPQAARLWPTEVRAIEKPTKVGMRQTFLDSLRRAEVVDRNGRHLGEQTVSLVERHRLALVASRVAKGLYYHVIGHALPSRTRKN